MICAALLNAGGSISARDEAKVIIINTCTVTAEAEAKTRKAIRSALKAPLAPWVIATGCAVSIDEIAYKQLGERVIAEPDRQKAFNKALELLGLEAHSVTLGGPNARYGEFFNTRRGVKIQDGCDKACSYCIVPAARGKARSIDSQDLIEQVKDAESHGIREVVLTGINIGAYLSDGADLAELIDMMLSITTELRLRLSSLEPQYVSDKLLTLMAQSQGRLCAHLHLPLQSGCDKTLQDMRRLYDLAYYADCVKRARDLMPQLALSTDVIVGFPGEQDEDFEESYTFCERMGFSRMHVFRYSRRPGTLSAQRPDQVLPKTSSMRSVRMRELAHELLKRDLASRLGTVEAVLVERQGQGRSESYHRVLLPDGIKTGSLVPMKFEALSDTLLSGSLLHFGDVL